MAAHGTISSFDHDSQAGVITSASGNHAIMFLAGDLKASSPDPKGLIGRYVTFEIISTARGNMAVNVSPTSRPLIRGGDWMAAVVAPVLVGAGTWYFFEWVQLSAVVAYLVSVNLVAFLMLVCHSNRGYSPKTRPSEVLLVLLAVLGGAVAVFFASALVPSKWRSDAGRFALFAMVVAQLIAIHSFAPQLLSRDVVRHVYRNPGESLSDVVPGAWLERK